jgi:hypothetical protein
MGKYTYLADRVLPHPLHVPCTEPRFAVVAHYVAGSLFALLSWWVASTLPYTPEEIAKMAHVLCTNGIRAALEPERDAIQATAREKQR